MEFLQNQNGDCLCTIFMVKKTHQQINFQDTLYGGIFGFFPKIMDKVGQTSELFLAFTDELEKQIFV